MPTTRNAATLAAEALTHRAAAGAADSQGHARAGVMLLRLLRAAQPVSRAELARRLGVNRSTVTDTFKPLIAAGVVREEVVQPAQPNGARVLGRPAAALSFNDGQDYFVGVNVGVRHSTVGLATLGGIADVITGLGVPRVIVSGRLVYGWKYISEPLRAAVAQSMAGGLTGWAGQAGGAAGGGLG